MAERDNKAYEGSRSGDRWRHLEARLREKAGGVRATSPPLHSELSWVIGNQGRTFFRQYLLKKYVKTLKKKEKRP